MSNFKYGDEAIQARDIMIAIPSMVIAVGILYFPGTLARVTNYADGWIAIIIGGGIAVVVTWFVAKLASLFPNQAFYTYASYLVSKPIAYILTLLFVIHSIIITSFEVSTISIVSRQYLFEETPTEIIALAFLLVVVYGVSGTRAAIFRLNGFFLPFIFFTTCALILFSISFMKIDNALPLFTTDVKHYLTGAMESTLSYSGIGIIFFYVSLVKKTKNVPHLAAFGMSWVIALYLLIYLTCILVFGQQATEVIRLPLIELAKSIEIPGGFFERIESFFFIFWITAIFTTALMAYDIAVMGLESLFPKVKKHTIVFILSPIIFLIGIIPNDFLENIELGDKIAIFSWGYGIAILLLLWIMYGIKGGNKHGN